MDRESFFERSVNGN